MGKVLNTIIAIIFTAFVAGVFMSAIEDTSTDENKTNFMIYNDTGTYGNTGDFVNSSSSNSTYSYSDTSSSRENLDTIGRAMKFEIEASTTAYNTAGDPISKLSAAFGIINAFVIGIGRLMLGVMIQGVNLFFGLGANLYTLPAPWNILAWLASIGVVMLFLTLVIRVINFVRGNEAL